jgi:2'-5' RNA ligase
MSRMPEWRAPTPRNREDSIRAFFALWPDPSASDALALLACETARRTQGRAPPSGNLHLTLVFLGDVAVTRVTALCAIGLAAASTVPPFPLTLDRTGTFRGSGIAWAGASATPRELDEFVQQLRDTLTAEGFAIERRAFQPHVTLARRCRKPDSTQISAPIVWAVSRIVLNTSEPASDGSRYRELASWPLGPRTADARVGYATVATRRAPYS